MKFLMICLAVILSACGGGDDGNNLNNTNNATNNETTNRDDRNVLITDCEDACVLRGGDCETSLNPTINYCKKVCFRLISLNELECISNEPCPSFRLAVEEESTLCEVGPQGTE